MCKRITHVVALLLQGTCIICLALKVREAVVRCLIGHLEVDLIIFLRIILALELPAVGTSLLLVVIVDLNDEVRVAHKVEGQLDCVLVVQILRRYNRHLFIDLTAKSAQPVELRKVVSGVMNIKWSAQV